MLEIRCARGSISSTYAVQRHTDMQKHQHPHVAWPMGRLLFKKRLFWINFWFRFCSLAQVRVYQCRVSCSEIHSQAREHRSQGSFLTFQIKSRPMSIAFKSRNWFSALDSCSCACSMHTDTYIEECVDRDGVHIYMESAQERDGGSERANERK